MFTQRALCVNMRISVANLHIIEYNIRELGGAVMRSARLTVSIDENVMKEASQLLDDFGMDKSTAINIFFKTMIKERRFPIDIRANDVDSSKSPMAMTTDELTNSVRQAVAGRNQNQEMSFITSMDIEEGKPYRLYSNGEKEYI